MQMSLLKTLFLTLRYEHELAFHLGGQQTVESFKVLKLRPL